MVFVGDVLYELNETYGKYSGENAGIIRDVVSGKESVTFLDTTTIIMYNNLKDKILDDYAEKLYDIFEYICNKIPAQMFLLENNVVYYAWMIRFGFTPDFYITLLNDNIINFIKKHGERTTYLSDALLLLVQDKNMEDEASELVKCVKHGQLDIYELFDNVRDYSIYAFTCNDKMYLYLNGSEHYYIFRINGRVDIEKLKSEEFKNIIDDALIKKNKRLRKKFEFNNFDEFVNWLKN